MSLRTVSYNTKWPVLVKCFHLVGAVLLLKNIEIYSILLLQWKVIIAYTVSKFVINYLCIKVNTIETYYCYHN